MEIFPAIDLKDNKIVRLSQGDYDKVKIYSEDVVSQVGEFIKDGAKYLHMVDLDGAKEGEALNGVAINKILNASNIFCQLGGGIRSQEQIEMYLNLGINRVILGTVAIEKPDFVRDMVSKYGDKIAVGIDAKNECVMTRGWLENSNVNSFDFTKQMADYGVKTVIYTDISKDGMLSGCNLDAYEKLSKINGLDIIASGGVSSLSEIVKLKDIGIYGAIVGKAIYEGKVPLSEALKI